MYGKFRVTWYNPCLLIGYGPYKHLLLVILHNLTINEARQIITKTITNTTYRNSTRMTKLEQSRSWIRMRCIICSIGFAITKPLLLNLYKYARQKCKLFVPSGYRDLQWERKQYNARMSQSLVITFSPYLNTDIASHC